MSQGKLSAEALADRHIKTASTLIKQAAQIIRLAGGNPAIELKPILDAVYRITGYRLPQADSVEVSSGAAECNMSFKS